MDSAQATPSLVSTLTEEHERLLKEYDEVREHLAKYQQLESDLSELIDACAKLLRAKGMVPESRSSNGLSGEEGNRPARENPSEKRGRKGSKERGDRVVAFLEGIYPQEKHFRDIYAEMAEEGMVGYGRDPANALLACFSSDDRLERVTRGTYRAKGDSLSNSSQHSSLRRNGLTLA